MIRLVLIILLLCLQPVHAQTIDALCRLRVVHKPADDVAYEPGVDVHGNAVVPADLNAQPIALPDKISFPLTVDLAQKLDQPLPQGAEMKADFGLIDVYMDGRVVYNGQDLSDAAAAACGENPAEQPPVALVEPVVKPEPVKPQNEEIIWGEGY